MSSTSDDSIILPEEKISFPGQDTFLKSKGRHSGLLTIFRRKEGKWQKIDYLPGKTVIRIGSASEKSEIVIDGDSDVDQVQVAIVYLADKILVIERGKKSITYVNGVKTPQAVLDDKSPALLIVGANLFIIKPKKSTMPKDAVKQNPFTVKAPNGIETSLEFDRPCIIGGQSACDVEIKGDDFMGMTIPIGKTLYLYTFVDMKIDGQEVPAMQFHPLKPLNQVNSLGFTISVPVQEGADSPASSFASASFKFLEVLADEQLGSKKMNLPTEGKSFLISRKTGQNTFHIDSKLISRKHAQVIVYDKSIMVEDCYSANGTYINGEKVTRKLMYPGDFLSLGDKTFLLGHSLKTEDRP